MPCDASHPDEGAPSQTCAAARSCNQAAIQASGVLSRLFATWRCRKRRLKHLAPFISNDLASDQIMLLPTPSPPGPPNIFDRRAVRTTVPDTAGCPTGDHLLRGRHRWRRSRAAHLSPSRRFRLRRSAECAARILWAAHWRHNRTLLVRQPALIRSLVLTASAVGVYPQSHPTAGEAWYQPSFTSSNVDGNAQLSEQTGGLTMMHTPNLALIGR